DLVKEILMNVGGEFENLEILKCWSLETLRRKYECADDVVDFRTWLGISLETTIGGHSIKQNVRYEPEATTSAPKKGAINLGNTSKSSSMKNQHPKATITSTKEGKITMSNSYAALEEESDEDVKNVYDESANLLHSKTGENSSTFTATAG
ncbi:hypothetical protein Tco_1251431, partial [Tanacetum coccineum]